MTVVENRIRYYFTLKTKDYPPLFVSAWECYQTLEEAEKKKIDRIIEDLSNNRGIGYQGALELVFVLGLFLNGIRVRDVIDV